MKTILTQTKSDRAISREESLGQGFLSIWTAEPSWSPIHQRDGQWITAKAASGKQVPLTEKAVERAYSRAIAPILGKRFGKRTNYFMLDIDRGSVYHPANGERLDDVLVAMEEIGLCRYIIIQSSSSDGLHIYFPLPESVGTWAIASAADRALRDAGINIAPGQCELFPNRKAYDSDYNGHRLPLQAGSIILDDDFLPVSDRRADFFRQWQSCAAAQDFEALQECFGSVTVQGKTQLAFTGKGQSNSLILAIAKQGVEEGVTALSKLTEYVSTQFPLLPGYDLYASPQSKRDTGWPMRAARWALKVSRIRKVKAAVNYHKAIADDATRRIEQAVQFVVEATANVSELSFYKLAKLILSAGRSLEGMGFSMATLYKYQDLIMRRIAAKVAADVRAYAFGEGIGAGEMQEGSKGLTPSTTIGLSKPPSVKEYKTYTTPQFLTRRPA